MNALNVFCLYGRAGASSRLRMFQYGKYISEENIDAAYFSLMDDLYLDFIYSNNKTRATVYYAFSIMKRMWKFLAIKNRNSAWIEKELFPWLPWWIEKAFWPRKAHIVLDYDDAVFHRYDMHPNPLIRKLLGTKIDRLMAHADIVFAGNAYLAERAQRAGARDVRIIPTVVDLERYTVVKRPESGAPTIGWIGSPSTWRQYLKPAMPMLADVAERTGARILVIGAPKTVPSYPRTTFLPWSEETEVAMIQQMDIGIMPLEDTPWARGKCGYKLIQYMACGLPVVASPVGVNKEIVQHGIHGFLAESEAEWKEALQHLASNPDLRQRMGQAGRKLVETRYSLQVYGPKVARIFHETMRDKRKK